MTNTIQQLQLVHFVPVPTEDPAGEIVPERPIQSVRRRLRELGLTQKVMAQDLFITEKTVSRALTEAGGVSTYMLDRMLDYVGLTTVAITTPNAEPKDVS